MIDGPIESVLDWRSQARSVKRHASKSSRSEPLQSRSRKVASTGEEGRQSIQFKCPSIQRRICGQNSNTSTSCAMTSTKNKTEFSLLAPVSRPLRHRIASTERSLSSQMLRHWRPSLWANRESSGITVAECFGCRIWIIANRQCSTASARRPRAAFTSTPSIITRLGQDNRLARYE